LDKHSKIKLLRFLVSLPRSAKSSLSAFIDILAITFALYSAFVLAYSSWTPLVAIDTQSLLILSVIPLSAVVIFQRLGLYRAVLRFGSAKLYLMTGIGLVFLSVLLELAIHLLFSFNVRSSVAVIFGLTGFVYVAGTRVVFQTLYQRSIYSPRRHKRNTLIYGAGSAGAKLISALKDSSEYSVEGFLDDDDRLDGAHLGGVTIFHSDNLAEIIKDKEIKTVLLALPTLPSSIRKALIDRLAEFDVEVRTVPSLSEMIAGESIAAVRSIDVNDLLGREPVPPQDYLLRESLYEKVVCVTGAGGSIGSELSRQALLGKARKLILFELSEFALYSIERELLELRQEKDLSCEILPILGSARNRKLMERVFSSHEVETVYHAAAYKHVPMVESNVFAGVCNNSFGTWHCALAALSSGVERFILISTDKAVRPTNVMGATKRLAELLLQDLATRPSKTIFSMVRFGNVLASSGSVVPVFQQQIAQGGPVTVTHPDINRFFMTIPEAASLVIQAGSMAQGGEVYLLDMGEPVRIADLARKMIRLAGRTVKSETSPFGEIEIEFTGLRPGEKLYEELLIGLKSDKTSHPSIFSAREEIHSQDSLLEVMNDIQMAVEANNVDAVKQALSRVVAGFGSGEQSNVVQLRKMPKKTTDL